MFTNLTSFLDSPDTLAIVLIGSHARGEATRHSDVDIIRLTNSPPEEKTRIFRFEDRMIVVNSVSPDDERKRMNSAERCIWTVPPWRVARVLLDREETAAMLVREAIGFDWDTVRAEAETFAAKAHVEYAEERNKIRAALESGNEGALLYASFGMLLGLTTAVAVGKGVMIPTENHYFARVQEAAGIDSEWTRSHRLLAGFTPATPVERGRAALELHHHTCLLFREILCDDDGLLEWPW